MFNWAETESVWWTWFFDFDLPWRPSGGGGIGSSGHPTIIPGQPGSGINSAVTMQYRFDLINTVVDALPNRIGDPDCNAWLQTTVDTLKTHGLSDAISKPSDLIAKVLNQSQIYSYGGNRFEGLRNGPTGAMAKSDGSGIYIGEHFYGTAR